MRDYPRAVRRVGAVTAAAALAGTAFTGTAFTGTGLTAPTSAGPAWCRPGGTLSARAMPRRVKIADCDLRGRTVRGPNGLAAVVPADGTSLVAHELRTDGAAELRIRVDERDGEITIDARGGRVPQGRPRGFRAPAAACADGTHRSEPSKWPKGTTVQWRYSAGTSGLSRDPIAKGIANVVGSRTDCDPGGRFTPPPDIAEHYAGQAAQPPNVTGAADCGKRDGANTFGWQAMPDAGRDVLAATCTWFKGTATVESDMALQTQGKRWWTDGSCPAGSYSAEAVATHESGHVLGLAHVEGIEHENLTMAPSIASCDGGPATLGKGDHDGLIALYGGR
ncbi:matrixin family metalloprotease [Actinomadura bangladeshensis]|uniref:Matrixin family metalloprotease n=1 Tax=Actinomadura bangladeshensis TaxID=453573 RepID=A0A4R4NCV2_9ACTN|nr:matrixin family metalloprotease [Actinomadura bangladeshensis]TDC05313.1 matrixin family metalloprotease [Actinomadura bangladeshensis]